MLKVYSSDIRLDVSVAGVDGYECGAQEALVVENGVYWRHRCIDLAVICKDVHLRWCAESLFYFLVRGSCRLHIAIPLATFHTTLYKGVCLLARDTDIGECPS